MGIILSGIGVKLARGADLVARTEADITLEAGIDGDVRGKGGKSRSRQVTIISKNQWRDACSDMGWTPELHSWMLRRAGLCFEGIWFDKSHIGKQARIGKDVVLEITGETTPCDVMNTIGPGLKDVLSVGMRGGVSCRVLQGGHISTGDSVVVGHILSL